jgi:hypothetical protein
MLPGSAVCERQGDRQECRFDVLISNYDATGRDLLIEAKPYPDRGSLRIAIAQLLDYRRFLPHQVGTDLAVLTITRPPQEYMELLQDLQITVLWFEDTGCGALSGDGKAWKLLKARILPNAKGRLPGSAVGLYWEQHQLGKRQLLRAPDRRRCGTFTKRKGEQGHSALAVRVSP